MKGCVVALILLSLLVAGVCVNAGYVHSVSRLLTDGLEALPDEPVPRETAEAVGSLRQDFERRCAVLELTVPYTTLDRIRESLRLLELYAAMGEAVRYTETLVSLLEMAEEITRGERISA